MTKKTKTFRFDEGSEEDKWADSQINFNYSMKLLVKLAIKTYGVQDLGYALIENGGGSLRDTQSSKYKSSKDNIRDLKEITSEVEQPSKIVETVEEVDTPDTEVSEAQENSKPTKDQINNFFGNGDF